MYASPLFSSNSPTTSKEAAKRAKIFTTLTNQSDTENFSEKMLALKEATNAKRVQNIKEILTTKIDAQSLKVIQALDFKRRERKLLVGKQFLDLCHPEDQGLVNRHFISTVQLGQCISKVYRVIGMIGDDNDEMQKVTIIY